MFAAAFAPVLKLRRPGSLTTALLYATNASYGPDGHVQRAAALALAHTLHPPPHGRQRHAGAHVACKVAAAACRPCGVRSPLPPSPADPQHPPTAQNAQAPLAASAASICVLQHARLWVVGVRAEATICEHAAAPLQVGDSAPCTRCDWAAAAPGCLQWAPPHCIWHRAACLIACGIAPTHPTSTHMLNGPAGHGGRCCAAKCEAGLCAEPPYGPAPRRLRPQP